MEYAGLLVVGLCLMSAAGHAASNVLVKASGDRMVFRTCLNLVTALWALPFVPFVALPNREAFTHLLIGIPIHWAYQMAMLQAFNRGDFGQVYPVMRGLAPALAAMGAFFVFGEMLNWLQLVGLLIACATVAAFAGLRVKALLKPDPAILWAVLTAILIGLYTTNDAAGIRANGDPWPYVVWFFILEGFGLGLTTLWVRRAGIIAIAKPMMGQAFIAGTFGVVSFGAALVALSMAPVAIVTALRETSVIFGAIFAAWFLKEGFGPKRIMLSIVLVGGLALLKLA